MNAARSSILVAIVLSGCGTPRTGSAAVSPPAPPPSEPAPPSEPPRPPAPARPAAVDGSLPAPENTTVLGTSADGRALLSITATTSVPGPEGTSSSQSYRYYAVLDARHECLEETAREDEVLGATRAETDADAMARLQAAPTLAELARLRDLARRFGVRGLGSLVFGDTGTAAVVEAHGRAYVVRDGQVTRVEAGAAMVHAMSPDGRWAAIGRCGARCRGIYEPALLDVATGAVRAVPVGNLSNAFWSPDGELFITYEDRAAQASGTRQVCLARLAPDAARPTTLHCAPSGSTSLYGAVVSDRARFLAVKLLDPGTNAGRLQLYALPGGEEGRTIGAEPMVPDVDDAGQVAWDDVQGPGSTWRVHLVSDGGEEIVPAAKAAGFLGDGALLLQVVGPRPPEPATLATAWCGSYRAMRAAVPSAR